MAIENTDCDTITVGVDHENDVEVNGPGYTLFLSPGNANRLAKALRKAAIRAAVENGR